MRYVCSRSAGQRLGCGVGAHRCGFEGGIEAVLPTRSDVASSTSCPRPAARRAARTTGKFGGSCPYPGHLAARIERAGIAGIDQDVSKGRVASRRQGCHTFTSGSSRGPFERLASVSGCRSSGAETANSPTHCKCRDEWPLRSAHTLAWPVWSAREI